MFGFYLVAPRFFFITRFYFFFFPYHGTQSTHSTHSPLLVEDTWEAESLFLY